MDRVFNAYSDSVGVAKLEQFIREQQNSLTPEQFRLLNLILEEIDTEMLEHETA